MKNTLTLLALLLIAFTSRAQITLDHTFGPQWYTQPVLLSVSGVKIVVIDTGTTQIKLYNSDFTIWKTVNSPTISGYKLYPAAVYLVSEKLFNLDNNVEMILYYSATSGSGAKSVIIDEFGSIILDLGPCVGGFAYNDDGHYKLVTRANADWTSKIYSLPGSLPCNSCGGSTGIFKPASGTTASATPNPSSGTIIITYQFPVNIASGTLTITDLNGKVVMQRPLSSQQVSTTVNTSAFAPGNYVYSIAAEGLQPFTNIFTVLK